MEGGEEIADQRSSKSAVAIVLAATAMLSVEREGDRAVETVATIAIKAMARNPVILLCFVMRNLHRVSLSHFGTLILLSGVNFRSSSSFRENGFLGTAGVSCRSDRRNLFTDTRSPPLRRLRRLTQRSP